jgi:hypothetical protein
MHSFLHTKSFVNHSENASTGTRKIIIINDDVVLIQGSDAVWTGRYTNPHGHNPEHLHRRENLKSQIINCILKSVIAFLLDIVHRLYFNKITTSRSEASSTREPNS